MPSFFRCVRPTGPLWTHYDILEKTANACIVIYALFFFPSPFGNAGKKQQLSSWERLKQCYRDLHLASHDSGVTKRGQCLFTPHTYIFMWTGPVALCVAVHHTQVNYKCATLLWPVRSLSIEREVRVLYVELLLDDFMIGVTYNLCNSEKKTTKKTPSFFNTETNKQKKNLGSRFSAFSISEWANLEKINGILINGVWTLRTF